MKLDNSNGEWGITVVTAVFTMKMG